MNPTIKDKEFIQKINELISEGLSQWYGVLLTADADQWSFLLDFSDEDALNAIGIFQCVLQNIGIKRGYINEQNATQLGKDLRKLIQEFCGIDTHKLIDELYPISNNNGNKTLLN